MSHISKPIRDDLSKLGPEKKARVLAVADAPEIVLPPSWEQRVVSLKRGDDKETKMADGK